MKSIIQALLDLMPKNKWATIVLYLVLIALGAVITFTSQSCSVHTATSFHVDSAKVNNMSHNDSTSITINPLRMK